MSLLTESKNIVQLLELLPPPKWNFLTSDKRKITLLKSKLTEEPLLKKLTLPTNFSNKKLELTLFSNKTKIVMFWELPKVKDSKESSKDLELNIYKRNLIEGIEKLDVLEHGTHLELDGLFPELVNLVITIELKWIKKSID